MPEDLLEQGPERESAGPSRVRRTVVVVAALAVVGAGALQVRGDEPTSDPPPAEALRPLPRVWLDRAVVLTSRPVADGVLQLGVGLEGVPGAQLLSVELELPGSAVVLRPTPARLGADGTALLSLEVLPTCPQALPGLSRGAVRAVVRGRERGRVRQVRVRLDTAGGLTDAVRARCGAVAGVPDLRTSRVELAAPGGDPLRTAVDVSATGRSAVTVVAVQPGPGLRATARTPLPVVLRPGEPPVRLRVDLRPGGCGGAPDTPPYVLELSTGEVVVPSVAPDVQRPLDVLRPYQCAG